MWKCRNNSGSKEKKTSNCFWFGYETKQKPYSITKNRQNKKNTIKLSKTKFKWYGKKLHLFHAQFGTTQFGYRIWGRIKNAHTFQPIFSFLNQQNRQHFLSQFHSGVIFGRFRTFCFQCPFHIIVYVNSIRIRNRMVASLF